MSQYAAQRFGQDTAPRIATTAMVLAEATELAPVPTYQPLIPFVPPGITTGTGGTVGGLGAAAAAEGNSEWKQYPDRLDLYAYQGDDVQIPLYFQDPANPTLDLSTDYDWKSQIRVIHRYYGMLVNEFSIASEYIPPADPVDPTSLGSTLVTLFLPRFHNQYVGIYQWDLQSTSPYTGPDYPKPDNVADEDWPMTTQVKTWLYGRLYVVPRVTSTDYLPVPPNALPVGGVVVVTPAGWTVGPNGRVP